MIKIVSIVGARPQFVKASVLRQLFQNDDDFQEILIHTGQHYDVSMSDIFFEQLNIAPPEYKLGINGKGHGEMTGRMLMEIETVLEVEKPQACLVYGDTNSTLAGALAAAKLHIPVIHVEAGLRSFNKSMPEEINRIMTDHVSDLLFCSTDISIRNLQKEGITKNVFPVGDIMYDATLHAMEACKKIESVQGVDIRDKRFAVCTLHRAENTDDEAELRAIIAYLQDQGQTYEIILPLHPRTKKALETFEISTEGITLIGPVSYIEMQALLFACAMVFTDSGGLQKEAYFHQKPCVTLRGETEWVELVEAGWNRLWRGDDFLPRRPISEYGRGHCGELIKGHLRDYFLS